MGAGAYRDQEKVLELLELERIDGCKTADADVGDQTWACLINSTCSQLTKPSSHSLFKNYLICFWRFSYLYTMHYVHVPSIVSPS